MGGGRGKAREIEKNSGASLHFSLFLQAFSNSFCLESSLSFPEAPFPQPPPENPQELLQTVTLPDNMFHMSVTLCMRRVHSLFWSPPLRSARQCLSAEQLPQPSLRPSIQEAGTFISLLFSFIHLSQPGILQVCLTTAQELRESHPPLLLPATNSCRETLL